MSNFLNDYTRSLLDDRIASSYDVPLNAEQGTSSDPGAFTQDLTNNPEGLLRLENAQRPQELNIGGGSKNAAIQRRADAKFYNPEEEKSKRMLAYTQRTANKMAGLKDLSLSQYRLDNAAQSAEMNRIAAENAQRNAVIGQVLGLGGMVVGAAIAGPAGAAIGGQAGNMAGQSINQHGNVT